MAFDVAKCMIRTPEQTREDIESVNRCLNPLSLVSTTDLIAELCRREGVRGFIVTLKVYFRVFLNRNETVNPEINPEYLGPPK